MFDMGREVNTYRAFIVCTKLYHEKYDNAYLNLLQHGICTGYKY